MVTGNKGAVGISFLFNGTSMGFVNCHLTSGSDKALRYAYIPTVTCLINTQSVKTVFSSFGQLPVLFFQLLESLVMTNFSADWLNHVFHAATQPSSAAYLILTTDHSLPGGTRIFKTSSDYYRLVTGSLLPLTSACALLISSGVVTWTTAWTLMLRSPMPIMVTICALFFHYIISV